MLKNYHKLLSKLNKNLNRFGPFFMLIFMLNLSFPHVAVGQTVAFGAQLPIDAGKIEILKKMPQTRGFPEVNIKEPRWTVNIWVTAYNSHPAQTDATPCITASGLNVCERNTEDILATNFRYLPFGTKVRLPQISGNKIYTIEDRMNTRYGQTVDIWMKDYDQARQFGRQYTIMEIL